MPKGPLKLIVNASAFDKKVRKKAMYMLKKELIAQKITSASKIKLPVIWQLIRFGTGITIASAISSLLRIYPNA